MSQINYDIADVATSLQALGGQAPFYCVPGIGNNVLQLHALAQRMGKARRLVALRTGYAANASGHDSVENLAARAVDIVLKNRSEGPILLGGYSGGASVAFEMAQQLTARNHAVGLLALIDTRRPGWRASVRTSPAIATNFVRNLPGWVRDDLAQSSLRQALKNMRRHARRIAGAGTAVERIIDVSRYPAEQQYAMQREYDMLEAYRPVAWPGRITLLRAETQPVLLWHEERGLGWSSLAGGGIDIISLPGNHLTIMREPRVGALAAALDACIASVAQLHQEQAV